MKKSIKVIMVFILFIILIPLGGYLYYQQSLTPVEPGNPVIVTIPPGSSTNQIASILEEHRLIRNSQTFTWYVRLNGKGSRLQAGQYQFEPGQTVDEIVRKLANGEVYVDMIDFTVPEGWTVTQIADMLAKKGYVNREKFLQEVEHGEFDYEFIRQIPDNQAIRFRLEGYLFPKTYRLKKGADEHEIIDRMLAQFAAEVQPAWLTLLEKNGLTLHEAITLASIVEREVVVNEERPRVAGVYFNRLARDIMLQADATIQYALGKQKEIITYKDLELNHPYNTYKIKGLPPGPIASPGVKSLEAVVYPEKHEFLFYVTKKDGSGEHYFSKTYREHLDKISLSKRAQK